MWVNIALLFVSASVGVNAGKYTWNTAEQSRQQWNANGGYAWETSVQSAGLRFGQWYSQYDIRQEVLRNRVTLPPAMATTTTTTTATADVTATTAVTANEALLSQPQQQIMSQPQQLLLSFHAYQSAAMRLNLDAHWYVGHNTSVNTPAGNTDTQQFLSWMKQHIRLGHSIAFGVFAASGRAGSMRRQDQDQGQGQGQGQGLGQGQGQGQEQGQDKGQGQGQGQDMSQSQGRGDYDHIVSLSSISSDYDDDWYHATDTLSFHDHHLTTHTHRFDSTAFVTTRAGCDAGLLEWCLPVAREPSKGNWAVAFTHSRDIQEYPGKWGKKEGEVGKAGGNIKSTANSFILNLKYIH